jgi:hypothetical protein
MTGEKKNSGVGLESSLNPLPMRLEGKRFKVTALGLFCFGAHHAAAIHGASSGKLDFHTPRYYTKNNAVDQTKEMNS